MIFGCHLAAGTGPGTVPGRAPNRLGSLGALILLSLVIHAPILYLVARDPSRATPLGDSQQYLALAENLILHHAFSLDQTPPFSTDVVITPGYPLLLAALLALGGHSMLAVALGQAGLRTLGAFLLLGIAERVLSSRATGWLAAVLWLLAPLPVVLTGIILTETLFTTLLLLSLWYLSGKLLWQNSLLAGLFFGLALITRPIAELLVPWALLLILMRKPLRSALVQVLPLALGIAIALGPWLATTSAQAGSPILSTIGANNLAYYTSASVLAHEQGISFVAAQQRVRALVQESLAQFRALHPASATPNEESALQSQVAFRILLAHPFQSAWFNLLDSINTLRPGVSYTVRFLAPGRLPSTIPEGNDFSPALFALGEPLVLGVAVALLLFYLPLYVLALGGLVGLLWKRRWTAVAALGLPSAILLYAPGMSGSGRFRAPFEPLLCLLAAATILAAIGTVRSQARNRPRLRPAVPPATPPAEGKGVP